MSWNNASDWHSVNRTYSKSVKDGPLQFYSNLINNNPGNLKHLFSTLNHFLKPQPSSPIEATEERCNIFIDFFRAKVNNIRSLMSSSSSLPLSPPVIDHLPGSSLSVLHFTGVRESHIEEILMKMKLCTCALDPVPTAPLKSYIPIPSPLITQTVNLFLQTGSVPSALKVAVICPLPMNPTLDPEVLASPTALSFGDGGCF